MWTLGRWFDASLLVIDMVGEKQVRKMERLS
jgi:hypothetical protein